MNLIRMQVMKVCRLLLDIIEIYIPAIMLICLFTSFIIGVFFRYVLKNPQPWTFELSSISFLWFVVLSWCFVQRHDRHVAFDMVYENTTQKTQRFMRIFSGVIIFTTVTILIVTSIKYVYSMSNLKTQIMKLPRSYTFICFPIAFIILDIRILHNLLIDICYPICGNASSKRIK